jgi:uncharacterized GH25 family protein
MTMKTTAKLAAVALLVSLPLSAEAHRIWMLPSATVLSGDDPWVTVDAAVSNDLFYFEHHPLRLANIGADDDGPPAAAAKGPKGKGPTGRRGGRPAELTVTAPDGSAIEAQNGSTGRYRSTFDVHLKQKGTYRIAAINDMLFASYKLGGERKRWRGTAETLSKDIPANAEDLNVTEGHSRVEVFVTSGKPTDTAFKSTGKGLELLPVTHPNDLVVGETVKFRFVADGKPAANMDVKVIPGGIRYRDKLGEMDFKTDGEGVLSFKVETPGMYWLNASLRDLPSTIEKAKRRIGYTATLEFLPQ